MAANAKHRRMTWRLLVVLLSVAPQSSVSPWKKEKGVETRELRFSDHLVSFTLSAEKKTRAGRSRELTVVHTVGKKELWRARDFVDNCEFDLTLEVIEGSIKVTDLDGDEEPEVSFLYKLACRSDVSPLTAKLLFYEGTRKYALRGETRERVGEAEYAGGAFAADPSFEQAPKPFVEFVKAQWKTLIVEAAEPQ
jgi:hypothetical protein